MADRQKGQHMNKPATALPLPAMADIVIVGGGLAGMVASTGLAGTGKTIIHLSPPAPPDMRTSALMSPSVHILQEMGLVPDPGALGEPLEKIRLIDATSRLLRAPEALFDCLEANVEAFGWNFSNQKLAQHILHRGKDHPDLVRLPLSAKAMKRKKNAWEITLDDGSRAVAGLVIGADGKNSFVRKNSTMTMTRQQHRQSALVCDLLMERELNGESVEYHYENGPFTLVPAGGRRANLVWVDKGEKLEETSRLQTEAIERILREKSQNLFGRLALETKTFVFPLSSHHVSPMGGDGLVLVGEAAHAFPPIGAQGLNLSLRDVAELMKLLETADTSEPEWALLLSRKYSKNRQLDVLRTGRMVDTLFKTLLSDFLPAQAMRLGGLLALKSITPLRKMALDMGMGAGMGTGMGTGMGPR